MNKFLGNSLTFKTFSYLKVNDTEVSVPEIEKKEFSLESDEKRELNEFNNMVYGVSKEIVEYNDKFENLYRFYESKEEDKKDYKTVELKLNDEEDELLDNHDLVAEKNSHLRLVLDYTSKGEKEKFRSSIIRILAQENSEVDLFVIQRDADSTTALESIAVLAKDNAKVRVHQYELGSGKLYANLQADLVGKHSSLEVDSIYFGYRDHEINMIYNIFHYGKESFSDVSVNGALKDNSYKNFKSNLDFKEGSSSSKGSEEEYTILLDDDVTAISVPLLLCHEDDVEGNHAASAGKIDQDLLFYIMSRGFSEKEAEALIIESKFSSSIDKLSDSEKEEEIWKMVHETVKM